MKCSNPKCNREIEEGVSDNEDSKGDKYCANCVAKIQLVAEQTGEYYD